MVECEHLQDRLHQEGGQVRGKGTIRHRADSAQSDRTPASEFLVNDILLHRHCPASRPQRWRDQGSQELWVLI